MLLARSLHPSSSKRILAFAAEKNIAAVTKYILANGAFVTTEYEICDPAGSSPVQIAAANGSVAVAKVYVKHIPTLIAKTHAQWSSHFSPMMYAAKNGHLGVVRVFTDSFLSPDTWTTTHRMKYMLDTFDPIVIAMANYHKSVVRFLFPYLDSNVWSGILPHAAASGWITFVIELLELLEGKNDEAVVEALYEAAKNGHLTCVEELVEHVDQNGLIRALQAAAGEGHDEVVDYILDHVDDKVEASTGALYHAVSKGRRDVVNLLIAHGCRVNDQMCFEQWSKRATILHWIARQSGKQAGLDRICGALIGAGANPRPSKENYPFPVNLMNRYPPKKTYGTNTALWANYERVRKALIRGVARAGSEGLRGGKDSDCDDGWQDHHYGGRLARELHVEFVEAVQWF